MTRKQYRLEEAEIQMRPRINLLSKLEQQEYLTLTEIIRIVTNTKSMNSDAATIREDIVELAERRRSLLFKQLHLEDDSM